MSLKCLLQSKEATFIYKYIDAYVHYLWKYSRSCNLSSENNVWNCPSSYLRWKIGLTQYLCLRLRFFIFRLLLYHQKAKSISHFNKYKLFTSIISLLYSNAFIGSESKDILACSGIYSSQVFAYDYDSGSAIGTRSYMETSLQCEVA